MNPLINLRAAILPLLITFTLPCFMLAPVAQAKPPHPTPTPTPAPTPTPTSTPTPTPPGEDRGNQNSAAEGVNALNPGTTGVGNTAHGWFSLASNTTGKTNTANGLRALYFNTTGNDNTAIGFEALIFNTTGNYNTANGVLALLSNTTGNDNTAIGESALYNNTTGSNNTALGTDAGNGVATANNVICIGANVLGADVSNTTWVGNVYGNATLNAQAAPVVVSVDGQLATNVSSQRFKKDIATMEKASEAILSLRPVTFHYKSDVKDFPQFGLIAEEVAKVNPALVLPDKEGKPYTVRYDAVNAMLLNEFLKEHSTVQELKSTVAKQEATIAQQRKDFEANTAQQQKEIEALTGSLQKVSAQLAAASPPGGGLEASKPAPQVVNNP